MAITYTQQQWDDRERFKAAELQKLHLDCAAKVAAAEKDRDDKLAAAKDAHEAMMAEITTAAKAITVERAALAARLEAVCTAHASGDPAAIARELQSETEKKRAALAADIAAKQAELAKLGG